MSHAILCSDSSMITRLTCIAVIASAWVIFVANQAAMAQEIASAPFSDRVLADSDTTDFLDTAIPLEPMEEMLFGYDDGFVLAVPSNRSLSSESSKFELKMNGWGQLRHTVFNSEVGGGDLNQFQLKRARIIGSGFAFTRDFRYYIQLDGRSSSGDSLRLLDYKLTYDVGHHALGWNRGRFGIKTGKYKMPFHFSRWLSGREFEFADRSMASTFFDVNRSLAFGVYGKTENRSVPLHWETAIFNGLVTGGAETGSSGSLDNNFAFSARVYAYPHGDWGKHELADFDCHETLATRFGAGFATTTADRSGQTEFGTFRVVDTGSTLASMLPLRVNAFDVSLYSLDASFKYRGWSGTAEYYFRSIGAIQGASIPDLFDHGCWFQLSRFIVPGKFQLMTRWSRVVGNSGTLGVTDQSSDEIAWGGAWYFREQHARFTFDVTRLDGAPINSSALDVTPGSDGLLFRSQIQFAF